MQTTYVTIRSYKYNRSRFLSGISRNYSSIHPHFWSYTCISTSRQLNRIWQSACLIRYILCLNVSRTGTYISLGTSQNNNQSYWNNCTANQYSVEADPFFVVQLTCTYPTSVIITLRSPSLSRSQNFQCVFTQSIRE